MKTIKDKVIFAFGKDNQFVEEIEDGEIVEFITHDCFNNQLNEENCSIGDLNWDCINPATGPVFVKGAEINDTLKVDILDIVLDKQGVMCALPNDGVLGRLINEESIIRLKVENDTVYFNDHINFKINPMIGVIGVACKEGMIGCGTPGVHGGNMDNKRITIGATLYLPVFHEGALFSLGDVHAAMGDGEIMVSGVEISAKVKVRISVLKGITIETPLLENEDMVGVIYSHENVEEAIFNAVRVMNEIIVDKLDLSFNAAGMLQSAKGDLKICQVVDPKRTVMMCMPKNILKSII